MTSQHTPATVQTPAGSREIRSNSPACRALWEGRDEDSPASIAALFRLAAALITSAGYYPDGGALIFDHAEGVSITGALRCVADRHISAIRGPLLGGLHYDGRDTEDLAETATARLAGVLYLVGAASPKESAWRAVANWEEDRVKTDDWCTGGSSQVQCALARHACPHPAHFVTRPRTQDEAVALLQLAADMLTLMGA